MSCGKTVGCLALGAALVLAASARGDTLTVTLLANPALSNVTNATWGGAVSGSDGTDYSNVSLTPSSIGSLALDVYVALSDGSPGNDGLMQLIGGLYNTSGTSGGLFNGAFAGGPSASPLFQGAVLAGATDPVTGNIFGSNSRLASSGWWGAAATAVIQGNKVVSVYGIPTTTPGLLFGTVTFQINGPATSNGNFSQPGYSNGLYFYPMNYLGATPTASQLSGFTGGATYNGTVNINGAKWYLNGTTTATTINSVVYQSVVPGTGSMRAIDLTGVTFTNNPFQINGSNSAGPAVQTQYGATQIAGAGTQFDIGGTAPGNSDNSYGQLNILTSPANPNNGGGPNLLSGTNLNNANNGDLVLLPGTSFNIVDWNGFVPTPGQTFTVLTWDGTLSGTASLTIDPAFAANGVQLVPQWNSNSLDLEATPEPGTLALLAAGAMGLIGYGLRNRKRKG
jgi:hypothetical protein